MRLYVQDIFDTSPEATPLMERINQESEALKATVDELQANITEKQSALTDLNGQIESEIQALTSAVGETQATIEQEITEHDAKTAELEQAMVEIKDGMIQVLQAAQDQMSSYQGQIEAGQELVESANQTAQSIIGEVHQHVDDGRQALHDATDFANEKIDGLQGKIDEVFEFTENTATEVIDRVDQGIQETGAKVEEMMGVSFEDLQSGFTTAMEMVQGNVIENGVNMAMDELQNRIQQELNQIIDKIVEELCECLGRVREGLFGNADEASLERKALEPILDQLDQILDPLFSAVDHVKGMAEMVGISV